jgi:hypothetical protein
VNSFGKKEVVVEIKIKDKVSPEYYEEVNIKG